MCIVVSDYWNVYELNRSMSFEHLGYFQVGEVKGEVVSIDKDKDILSLKCP